MAEATGGTVTILFTDRVGSTTVGDEAAQALRRAHDRILGQQFQRFDGRIIKRTGDGFMVAFASARRAVVCAVAIQRALEEHYCRQPPDQQVLVRIGLNTGEAIQEERDLFGEAVNAAMGVFETVARSTPRVK